MNRKSLGIHLINLLSYPQKFTLIGFLFAIPLTWVMYLLICEINSLVYFFNRKFYGNQYLRPLRQLREYIPKLQLLNYQSLNPNLSNSASRANLEAKIDANFQSLANTDPQVGNILMFRENLNKFNQNLQKLKLRCRLWSLETYDFVYQRLAADINRLSARVGDTSYLIFDPDLDIYYLINATLLNLPEMQKILSQIRLIYQKISLRSDPTPEERSQLITLSSRLREINDDLAINMEVAFSNNPQGNRRLKLTHNLKKINSLVKQLTKQLAQRTYQIVLIKHDAYINGRNFAFNSSLRFGNKTINELEFWQKNRIIFFIKKQELSVVLVLNIVIFIHSFFTAPLCKLYLFLTKRQKKKQAAI